MTPNGWDKRNSEGTFVKMRSLEGTTFTLKEAKPCKVKGRPAYLFELADGRLFTVGPTQTIGQQVERSGLPPAGEYTIEAFDSETSPTGKGYKLVSI
jgi:hypothetical protein